MVKILAEQAVSATNPTVSGKSVGFDRSVNYQQSGGVSGIESAFNNAAAGAQASAQIGIDIANSISVQNAEARGMQLGHDQPGMDLIPAFTKADQVFVNSYRQEERSNTIFNGTQYLDQAASIVHQNPTPENLAAYQAKSQETISGLLATTSNANRNDVERSLQGAYQGQFMQLSNSVETRNRQVMTGNYNASTASNLESIYNLRIQGLDSQAQNVLQNQWASSANAENIRLASPEQIQKTKEEFKEAYNTAGWIKKINDAKSSGGDEAVHSLLEDYARNPPQDLTPLEYEKVGASLLGYVNQQNSLQKQAEQYRLADVTYKINSGQITNQGQLQNEGSELTAYDYLQASETLLRANKGSGAFEAIQTAIQRADGSIANFSPSELQSAYDRTLKDGLVLKGTPNSVPTFADKTNVIAQMNTSVESYFNEANFSLKRGNPQRAAEVMDGLQYLADNAPDSLNFKDPQARSIFEIADNLNRYSAIPLPEAVKIAQDQIANPKLDIQQRAENWSKEVEIKRNADGTTRGNVLADAYEDITGHSATDVGQDAAFFEFSKIAESHYLQTGDFETTKIATKRDMNKAWGSSKWGANEEETMYLPPDKAIPLSEVGAWFENQVGITLQALADNHSNAVQSGQKHKADVEIPKDKRIDLKNVDEKSFFSTKQGPGRAAIIDGKERNVFLKTDGSSRFGKGLPTYYLYYHDDFGIEQPITDPYNESGFAQFNPVSLPQFLPEVYKELQDKDVNGIANKYLGKAYDAQHKGAIPQAVGGSGATNAILYYLNKNARKKEFINKNIKDAETQLQKRLEEE